MMAQPRGGYTSYEEAQAKYTSRTPLERVKMACLIKDHKPVPALVKRLVMLDNILRGKADYDLTEDGDKTSIEAAARSQSTDSDDDEPREELDNSLEGIFQYMSVDSKQSHQLAAYYLAGRALQAIERNQEDKWGNKPMAEDDLAIQLISDGDRNYRMVFKIRGNVQYKTEPHEDKIGAIQECHVNMMNCGHFYKAWLLANPKKAVQTFWNRGL
jgi:hypothetical protein